ELKTHDDFLGGAVGDRGGPSGVVGRGQVLQLRFACDHHINGRLGKLLPGGTGPLADGPEMEVVVVRGGTGVPYVGNGRGLAAVPLHQVATHVRLNPEYGIERLVRGAYRRPAPRLPIKLP
ncbi:hypothetical protein UK12_33765, partial [Saccharothrix sp. ST-888]